MYRSLYFEGVPSAFKPFRWHSAHGLPRFAYGGAGIHLMSGYGEVVATTSGAKLCYGQNTLSVTGSGAHTNCTMTVGGNLSVSGGAAPEYDGAGSLG